MPFVTSVFESLVDDQLMEPEHRVLAVAAGANEREIFSALGFRDVVISNLDERAGQTDTHPFEWSRQDAQSLSFDDGSFDWAVVVDGLHHCHSPHAGLLELYRVARNGIVAVEARDSALMRLAIRTGLTGEHEIEAVVAHHGQAGGVDNTAIPNYVYRWTEAEFEKTIRSFDPSGRHTFRYAYGLHLPWEAADMRVDGTKRAVLRMAGPVLAAVTTVFKRQRNSMAMIAVKPDLPVDMWPWLTESDDGVTFDLSYAATRFSASDSRR